VKQSARVQWWRQFTALWQNRAALIHTPQHRIQVVACIFVGSTVVAGMLFWLPLGFTAEVLTWHEAWFLAVSALTASGASLRPIASQLTPAGMWLILVLLQCGGAGFMSITVTILQQLGVTIFARTRIKGMHLFWAACAIELWAGLLLAWQWRAVFPSYGDALFAGLFHATSAFTNAGFDWLTPDSPLIAMTNDLPSLAVIATTVLVGSLGLPVVVDVITSRRRLAQTTLSLAVTLLLVSGSIVTLWATPEWQLMHRTDTLAHKIMAALMDALSWRTAGIFTHADIMQMPVTTRIGLLIAMFTGCAPGTMGGGVTPTTMVVVALAVWGAFRRSHDVRLFGQRLAPAFVRRTSIMLISSVMLVCGIALLVALIDGVAADYAVVLATAAFATSNVNAESLYQLSWLSTTLLGMGMMWGRIGVFLVIASLYGHVQTKHPASEVWAG
jgi:trk system potassium uptake protein TrkH